MVSGGFQNIFKIPELKRRVLYTLGLLIVYRIGVHVPTPGIDSAALANIFSRAAGTIFGLFNMFSGGALERLSVFALGIMPYISSSIILQLMTVVVPYLERLSKEGTQGRKKITQYTRYGTVFLSIIQGFGISVGLEQMGVVISPGWSFRFMTVITLTAGTAFIMWLGEQITERGIGNGISLIIFAGIICGVPRAVSNVINLLNSDEIGIFLVIILLIFMLVVLGIIIFVEQAQRRIPVQYAKRIIGRRMMGGQSTHLPLKINTSGVIPPIFASSIMMFPATAASFITIPWLKAIAESLHPGNIIYNILYIALIFFFCYFYTAVSFNPIDVAENMKKHGGFIPGIRPGKRTSDYIDRVLTRITLGGAVYIATICILPTILISKFDVPFYYGGTSLLIVVGVAIDTISQMESHMLSRHYDGFLKKSGARIKGRQG
jgi:preprotein translocase subunit SecY